MRFRLMLLTLLLAVLTVGCGQVAAIHYVPGVNFDPEAARHLPLDQVFATDAISGVKGAKILVQFEDPKKTIDRSVSKITPKLEENKNWDRLHDYFELCYLSNFKQDNFFSEVQRSAFAVPGYQPDYILKLAVTEWHEGNKWLRAYIGFGFGATRLQTEGMLINTRTNKTVFAFADARIHPGGPSVMGFPRKVWRGPDLLTEDLNWQSKDVFKTIRKLSQMQGSGEAPR